MEKDIDVFIDAEEFVGSSKEASFRSIILNHISKISLICIKEFKEGYWQKKPISTAGGVYMSETYVEDMRLAYINAIDFLYDSLLPHFDTTMKRQGTRINNKLNSLLKSFTKNKKSKTDWIDEKLSSKRKLFQELNLLLYRLKYLESTKFVQ